MDISDLRSRIAEDEERFVYLEHPEVNKSCSASVTALRDRPMQHPFGQGAMFQIHLKILILFSRHACKELAIYPRPSRVWRKTGDRKSGNGEVFVQDA